MEEDTGRAARLSVTVNLVPPFDLGFELGNLNPI